MSFPIHSAKRSRPWLVVPLLAAFAPGASAQLEEIIVTATRRETNLQVTPMSIQAFTAEDLELGNIDVGADLGIMVPNVVLNPGTGQSQAQFYIRGMPGVGIYIDGVWQEPEGFQQTNFVEMERVEVLRGPQGTLFGRNTNGGAVNITTRRPADEFGARANIDLGEFNRRDVTLAADLPISDTLKTKWMVANLQNDGFLRSAAVPYALGGQDDVMLRADVLWEPTERFSLRFTANDEDKSSSDARIVRFTNLDNPNYIAYNVLAGNPDFLAQARAIDPTFPDPPVATPFDRFTPESHQPGYPGGSLGQWETRSDTLADGIRTDVTYYTLTMDWAIADKLSLESITSSWEQFRRQLIDFDGSEFTVTTTDDYYSSENFTQELHLTGSNFRDRVTWLAGLYFLDQKEKFRRHSWVMHDFAVPGSGYGEGRVPGPPGVGGRPLWNEGVEYVRSWGALLGNDGIATFAPLTWLTGDRLLGDEDEDKAFFGEVTVSATDRLDVTMGVRVTADDGRLFTFIETDGFRGATALEPPTGDLFGGVVESVTEDPDLGNVTTNKFALSYQISDDVMVYGSYGEGFTSAEVVNCLSGIFPLDPEVMSTREFGLRSDWMGGRLRFNASYFATDWNGMRVIGFPTDSEGNTLPIGCIRDDGVAEADGWEFELDYLLGDRWQLKLGLGLLDTNYINIGDVDPRGTGIQPGQPFAYAPEDSVLLGIHYDLPLSNGGHVLFVGQYGWSDKYVRDAAAQRTPVDSNGKPIFEPSYGILNARVLFEPADANWSLALWGRNLTDEYYINGGFDTRDVWSYDFSVIGRSREIGVTLGLTF
jgi:iron complex outermembrane receptor protein